MRDRINEDFYTKGDLNIVDVFLFKLAEILEVDSSEVSMGTDFRSDIDDWDSMKGFSILVMLEDDYHVLMEVEEFLKCKTVGDLYARIA